MRPSGYRTADDYLAAKQFAEKAKGSPRDPSKPSSLFEASKKFSPVATLPANDSESPNERLTHTENGRIVAASEDSNALLRKSGVSTNRPALELTMYILLGLFVLIALIFAVNCGAMVARYRWEHARIAKEAYRLQHLSELAMNGHNEDSAMESSGPTVAQDYHSSHSEFFTEPAVINSPSDWKTAFLSVWRTFGRRFSRRVDSNQPMSADNDWVWLGRDVLERRTKTIPSSRGVTKLDLLQDAEQQEEEEEGAAAAAGRSIRNLPQHKDSWTENCLLAEPPAPCSSVLLTEAVVLPMQTSSDFSSAGADYHFCRQNTLQRPSAPGRPPQLRSNDEGYTRLLSGSANRCQDKSQMALPESTSKDPKPNKLHFYDSSAPATTFSPSHPQKWQDNENFFIRFPETDTKTACGPPYASTAYNSRSRRRTSRPVLPQAGGPGCITDQAATCFGSASNPLGSHHRHSESHRQLLHSNWPHHMTISTPSPWVHRKYSQASVNQRFPPKLTLTPDLQRSPQCHSFGYQTLPASNLAWQECSDSEVDQPDGAPVEANSEFETPPSPPIRTSSKFSQRISYISSGQHANLFRPVSFPSSVMVQSPLVINTAVNDVYNLLDSEPSLQNSTRLTAHNRHFVSCGAECQVNDEQCPRRAWSHSRIFPSISATTPNSTSEDIQGAGGSIVNCPPSGDAKPLYNLPDCCKPLGRDSKETQLPPCKAYKVGYCYHQKAQPEKERSVYANCTFALSPSALSRYHALLPSKQLVAGMRRSIT
ncbi:unnamed protein product [Dibothriocephalus latus]|uniref:Uncharacterized protein n=1 Tax=Dibothriocephalus latus TaxID=60516 RepID=A0A3P7LI42_DIBLA|nr:unnamed protein product [Dibothriocephalus latus]